MTVNRYGQGYVLYVGALGHEGLYGPLVEYASRLAALPPPVAAADGIEIAERWQGAQRLLFLLNHSRQAQSVSLPGRFTDLLARNAIADDAISVGPLDVRVLSESTQAAQPPCL